MPCARRPGPGRSAMPGSGARPSRSPGSSPRSRRVPSRLRIWVTASREDRSMSPRALAAASGSRSMTRRAAAAWMPMTETWWPTTSCSSRAMRSRSSVTARRRRVSLCAADRARPARRAGPCWRALRHEAWPPTTAPAEVDGVDEQGQGDGGGHRAEEPVAGACRRCRRGRPGPPLPTANCSAIQTNIAEHDRADDADHEPAVARPRDAGEDRDEVDELEGELPHDRRHRQADDEHVGGGEGGHGERPPAPTDEQRGTR